MYTIELNHGYLEVMDRHGNPLSPMDMIELADKLTKSAQRQPILQFEQTEHEQLPLMGEPSVKRTKATKKIKKTADEILIGKRVIELKSLIATLNGIREADLSHGKEGRWAKKLASSPENWTDAQVEKCFHWVKDVHAWRYKDAPVMLYEIDKYISSCRSFYLAKRGSRTPEVEVVQEAAYVAAMNMGAL